MQTTVPDARPRKLYIPKKAIRNKTAASNYLGGLAAIAAKLMQGTVCSADGVKLAGSLMAKKKPYRRSNAW